MDTKVVLCADTESLKNPGFVGLEGESLDSQKWLRVFCSALEARRYLQKSRDAHEVWVASSDDVDPINLAAALKKDSVDKEVYLVACQDSCSLKSRASAAGIDATLSTRDFVAKYSDCKRGHLNVTPSCSSPPAEELPRVPEAGSEYKEEGSPLATRAISGRSAHVISVVSASGGAGKSTVAVLSALFSQGLGYRTLLLDADLQFGDMHYILGARAPLSLDRVMKNPSLLAGLEPDGPFPAFLSAPEKLEESELLASEIPRMLEALRSHFDVIIVNTGAFWTDQHISLIEKSSTALFLVDQRPSSLRACKHALDLCSRCGIAINPFLFVVNRCGRHAPLTSIDVSCALQGMHTLELAEGGKEVADLLGAGMPYELIQAKNELCISLERMLLDILPQTDQVARMREEKGRKKGFGFRRKSRRAACL